MSNKLESSLKFKEDLREQLDKYKKENDELLFRLEEKKIQLEGTRAQVRVLEKFHHQPKPSYETRMESSKSGENFTFLENDHLRSKGFSENEINRARQIFLESQNKKVDKSEIMRILNRTKNPSQEVTQTSFELSKSNNVIPIIALPVTAMTSHQSSGTESTHALEISSELEADMARGNESSKNESLKNEKSPYKRRPSKIPLNIQKTQKSLKSVTLNEGSPSLKKSDGDLNKSLKKSSLDNSQSSMTSRSPSQNACSIKYNSVGRTGSQLSIASQRSISHGTSNRQEKKKSLTTGSQKEDSLSSGKNMSLKQTTNFSNVRQRDTLSRKSQSDTNSVEGGFGKRTTRSSFRESFRSRISIDGNGASLRKESLLSGGRKDSLQLKQNRSNQVHQVSNLNKSVLSTESDKVRPAKLSFLSNWFKILDTNKPS